jgi:hypothetical protein
LPSLQGEAVAEEIRDFEIDFEEAVSVCFTLMFIGAMIFVYTHSHSLRRHFIVAI